MPPHWKPRLTLILEGLILREHVNNKWMIPFADESERLIGVLHGDDQEHWSKNLPRFQLAIAHIQ